MAAVIHEIPLERRTLHGHFSRPRARADDRLGGHHRVCLPERRLVALLGRTLRTTRPRARPWPRLVGPVEVHGEAGQTLEVRVESVRVGPWGVTEAAGWQTDLNDRLGVSTLEEWRLTWTLDSDGGLGRDQFGRELELSPFLGVMGMPHRSRYSLDSTTPCLGREHRLQGARRRHDAVLPIPVDGAARFSRGRRPPGRRRGLAGRDRVPARARRAHALRS